MVLETLGWIAAGAVGSIPGLVIRDMRLALFGSLLILTVIAFETGDEGALAVVIIALVMVLGIGVNWVVKEVLSRS